MKRIKATKTVKPSFFDSKRNVILVCIAAAVIVVLIAVLMVIETNKGKLVIENNTDLKLEYLTEKFVYAEGDINEPLQTGSLEAKDSMTVEIEPVTLLYSESNLEVRFKFENQEELFVDAGLFSDNFEGNIYITFENTEDPNLLKMKVKANNGLLSSRLIVCDEEFIINIAESYVD